MLQAGRRNKVWSGGAIEENIDLDVQQCENEANELSYQMVVKRVFAPISKIYRAKKQGGGGGGGGGKKRSSIRDRGLVPTPGSNGSSTRV